MLDREAVPPRRRPGLPMIPQTSAFAAGWLAAACLAIAAPAGAQDVHGDPRTPATARVLTTTIHSGDAEEVRYVVLARLTDRYASAKGITASQAEKDAYNKSVQDFMAQERARQVARRDDLTRRLAAPGLAEPERKALTGEIESVNSTLAALAEPAGASAEVNAARDQVAGAFVRQWKINRELYRQYGGRIIFQQGGPEPLDAYRRFLEESAARGDLVILDNRLEPAFWRYYRNDTIHSFFPAGSEEAAEAFARPPWQPK